MNNSIDDFSILTKLGLSISQAKAYIALAKTGSLTAQAISTLSGVARPDVYRILSQLEQAEIIERIIGKPVKFQAVNIDECISALLKKRQRTTTQLQEEAAHFIRNFTQNPTGENNKQDEHAQFILVPKNDAIFSKAEKMIKNAKKCICTLGTEKKILFWASKHISAFEDALSRKVNCNIIIPTLETYQNSGEPLKTLTRHSNFSLRLIAEPPKASIAIFDRKEILISTSAADSPNQFPALWSNNKSLVDVSRDYFEFVWTNSTACPKKGLEESRFVVKPSM